MYKLATESTIDDLTAIGIGELTAYMLRKLPDVRFQVPTLFRVKCVFRCCCSHGAELEE